MAQIVVMPALGNTVESCLVSTWLVEVGDAVTPDTVLCEVETDKSTMDVPAGASGTVLALLVEAGDDVPVKSPIMVVGTAGEDVEEFLAAQGLAPQTTGEAGEVDESTEDVLALDAQPEPAPVVPTAPVTERESASGASPRARALAEREGLALDAVAAGSGPHGRVLERDVAAALASGPRPTPGARGLDATGVELGTGLGGRVTREDIASPRRVGGELSTGSTRAVGEFPGAFTDTPLKGIRKLIAERMLNALAVSAQLSYDASAPAAGMLTLRKRFKASDPALGYSGITLGDLVNYATIRVLQRHANLNAHLVDGTLRAFESVHLGLAVDTPRGLLVPTIRNAETLTLRQLSTATKELAEAARGGKIDPELLTGATFTVSNLGSFGIEGFTPIINVPQTGILGVNTISPRAVLNPDGSVGVEQRIGFSLTADHQVVDGADAGRFLADLAATLADIDLVVMG